ncbi:hypothetical protein BH09SUM1_BH09SUM1_10850 [soil metagenome]
MRGRRVGRIAVVIQSETRLGEMKEKLDALLESNDRLPPLAHLSEFMSARELKKRHGQETKTFGNWNSAQNADPYSSKGSPFAAETSGTLYVIYSTGPDGVYDFQPDILRDALSRRNKGPLEDAGYRHRAAAGKGDIYVTNIEETPYPRERKWGVD